MQTFKELHVFLSNVLIWFLLLCGTHVLLKKQKINKIYPSQPLSLHSFPLNLWSPAPHNRHRHLHTTAGRRCPPLHRGGGQIWLADERGRQRIAGDGVKDEAKGTMARWVETTSSPSIVLDSRSVVAMRFFYCVGIETCLEFGSMIFFFVRIDTFNVLNRFNAFSLVLWTD